MKIQKNQPSLKKNKYTNSKNKTPKNYYFTQVHEDAVVKYAKSTDREEKSRLYRDFLQPAFNEMVDKIVYTYKYTSLPNIEERKHECKTWLTTILDKFDPTKGYKAFSYFTVITRNWFSHERKRHASSLKKEMQYDDAIKNGVSLLESDEVSTDSIQYLEDLERKEFWDSFMKEFASWGTDDLDNINRRRVYEALKILFDSKEEIEIFNKKAIYLYLREITGMNTKQIVGHLKKFREQYLLWREKWDRCVEEDVENGEERIQGIN